MNNHPRIILKTQPFLGISVKVLMKIMPEISNPTLSSIRKVKLGEPYGISSNLPTFCSFSRVQLNTVYEKERS